MVSAPRMKGLNRRFRRKDKVTDVSVVSSLWHGDPGREPWERTPQQTPEQIPEQKLGGPPPMNGRSWGEIFICVKTGEVPVRGMGKLGLAREFRATGRTRVALHVLDYDHEKKAIEEAKKNVRAGGKKRRRKLRPLRRYFPQSPPTGSSSVAFQEGYKRRPKRPVTVVTKIKRR